MVANNKPWQAVVNPVNLVPASAMENKLAVIKKDAANKQVTVTMKVVNPKRYSFDDNGGGYEGL